MNAERLAAARHLFRPAPKGAGKGTALDLLRNKAPPFSEGGKGESGRPLAGLSETRLPAERYFARIL